MRGKVNEALHLSPKRAQEVWISSCPTHLLKPRVPLALDFTQIHWEFGSGRRAFQCVKQTHSL